MRLPGPDLLGMWSIVHLGRFFTVDEVEDRTLSAALGDRYREYASRTHRLLPFVY